VRGGLGARTGLVLWVGAVGRGLAMAHQALPLLPLLEGGATMSNHRMPPHQLLTGVSVIAAGGNGGGVGERTGCRAHQHPDPHWCCKGMAKSHVLCYIYSVHTYSQFNRKCGGLGVPHMDLANPTVAPQAGHAEEPLTLAACAGLLSADDRQVQALREAAGCLGVRAPGERWEVWRVRVCVCGARGAPATAHVLPRSARRRVSAGRCGVCVCVVRAGRQRRRMCSHAARARWWLVAAAAHVCSRPQGWAPAVQWRGPAMLLWSPAAGRATHGQEPLMDRRMVRAAGLCRGLGPPAKRPCLGVPIGLIREGYDHNHIFI